MRRETCKDAGQEIPGRGNQCQVPEIMKSSVCFKNRKEVSVAEPKGMVARDELRDEVDTRMCRALQARVRYLDFIFFVVQDHLEGFKEIPVHVHETVWARQFNLC